MHFCAAWFIIFSESAESQPGYTQAEYILFNSSLHNIKNVGPNPWTHAGRIYPFFNSSFHDILAISRTSAPKCSIFPLPISSFSVFESQSRGEFKGGGSNLFTLGGLSLKPSVNQRYVRFWPRHSFCFKTKVLFFLMFFGKVASPLLTPQP